MTAPSAALDRLRRERPEWSPWLAVVDEIVRETAARRWDASVPGDVPPPRPGVPLLTGATIAVAARPVRKLFERLVRIASSAGTSKMQTLAGARAGAIDTMALFSAALCRNDAALKDMAVACGADPEALQAVATLVPLPLLQACHERYAASVPHQWMDGYCPICASWPAFAEVRGIERSRYFRCGRCGSAWHARALCCPYCAMDDHNELVTLVPEKGAESHGVIEACRRCLGYVKTFTTLQGCAPDTVMIEDLASVALDVAALQQGYTRPAGTGYALAITIAAGGAPRRFLAWSS